MTTLSPEVRATQALSDARTAADRRRIEAVLARATVAALAPWEGKKINKRIMQQAELLVDGLVFPKPHLVERVSVWYYTKTESWFTNGPRFTLAFTAHTENERINVGIFDVDCAPGRDDRYGRLGFWMKGNEDALALESRNLAELTALYARHDALVEEAKKISDELGHVFGAHLKR